MTLKERILDLIFPARVATRNLKEVNRTLQILLDALEERYKAPR